MTTKHLFIILAAGKLLSGSLCAAEPSADAGHRAYFYQREVRDVLKKEGWHISKDRNGLLVADHQMGPMGAIGPAGAAVLMEEFPMYLWLTVVFRAKSADRTDCTASIQRYEYDRGKKPAWTGPYPNNNEIETESVRKMLGKAEAKLGAKHPQYAAR